MNAITFKGRRGCFKRNKDENKCKKVADKYFGVIDTVIESSLSHSFSPSFIDSFMTKLFTNTENGDDVVKCAYLSTSTFQPLKFYRQLKKVMEERKEKKAIKYYDSQPALHELLNEVKKSSNEFIGIFNVSAMFDKKFFKKFVDLLIERSQNAVLIFVTMFNLGDESSLAFLGIPSYISTIYNRTNFVQLVQEGLRKTPLHPTTVQEELTLYDTFHRSDRILAARLKHHLLIFANAERDLQICHLLKQLQCELGFNGKLEKALQKAAKTVVADNFIKTYETFEECLHILGEAKSDELKRCLKNLEKVEKENVENVEEIFVEIVEITCELAPEKYEENKLHKKRIVILEDKAEYPPQCFVDNLNQPNLEDYKVVYEMISDNAHENRPIFYSEILERFAACKKNDMPKCLKKYSVEYYFRLILDTFAYCGFVERKSENPELIKFFPTPMYNLIKENLKTMAME